MKKSTMALLICVVFIFATAVASFAAMGEGSVGTSKGVDITLFGSNRVIPTYTKNLNDFDSDAHDGPTLTEGGWGAGFFVRNEFRMGWKGVGQDGKWGFKFILENDIHMSKANGDRNDYGGGLYDPAGTRTPIGHPLNKYSDDPFGSEFSVERQTFWYKFGPVRFSAGTDIQFVDIKTGGLVYGDDHPFLALDGGDKTLNWKVFMLLIEDSDNSPVFGEYRDSDWYAYCGKVNYTFDTGDKGKFTLTPFVAYSDMRKAAQGTGNVHAYYYGLGGHGSIGIVKPSFELVGVTGDITNADPIDGDDIDIQSYAAFASLTLALSPEFNPYIGFYWTQGDDDPMDGDADGFVGITNITRYTPTFGMEGGIMYEHLYAFGAPLYGLVPERKGANPAYIYGGIGGAGNGENAGIQYYGIGSKGKLQGNNSYKVQVAYMQYDEEDALGLDDDEIGWVLDAQVKHSFSKNFYTTFTFSCLDPGDGVEEFISDEDDVAINSTLELGWKW